MKATSSGVVIGIALEDFDENRAYSDTYINQYADNIIVPEYVPVTSVADPRINDGCYYGGGGTADEAPCVPLVATTSDAQVHEAETLAAAEARERELRRLAREGSARVTLTADRSVQVGQIVMFVDLGYRYLGEVEQSMLAGLMMSGEATSTLTLGEADTVWSRLVRLASGFVDGVLSLTGLKADRVETSELCVDDVCVTADDLRALLQQSNADEQVIEVVVPPVVEPQTPVHNQGEDGNTTVDDVSTYEVGADSTGTATSATESITAPEAVVDTSATSSNAVGQEPEQISDSSSAEPDGEPIIELVAPPEDVSDPVVTDPSSVTEPEADVILEPLTSEPTS